ncbi:MAG: hypothetical protein HN564_06595 [Flavobacteriales bacterium]|jgi:hypothetical protein|nr:hypothetical protein [Flavobacteriales bacterium]
MKKKQKISEKKEKILERIRNRPPKILPKIVFTSKNLIVTLNSENQLKNWLSLYPDGTYKVIS